MKTSTPLVLLLLSLTACSDPGPSGPTNDPLPDSGGGSDASDPVDDASTPDASHTPKCVGIATSCSALLDTQCAEAAGCSSSGSCDGYARSCSSKYSSCGLQLGCRYPSGSGACEGSAWPCSSFSGNSSCVGQEGCSWKQTCGGVAHACSTLRGSACALQPGCRLE